MGVALLVTGRLVGAAESTSRPPTTDLLVVRASGDNSLPTLDQEIAGVLNTVKQPFIRLERDLAELAKNNKCASTERPCWQKIGRAQGARQLFLTQYKKNDQGVEATLRVFDVAHALDSAVVTKQFPLDEKKRKPMLDETVRRVLGIFVEETPQTKPKTGELAISAPSHLVEVVINGQPRGTTPLHLRELEPGQYAVVARRGAYIDYQGVVEVKAGETTWVDVNPTQAPTLDQPPGFFESLRWPTLASAATGIVLIGVGAGFAIDMASQQSKFDQLDGSTIEEIERMQDHKDAGERDALISAILFSVGGAALVTSAVLAYFDYRDTRPKSPPPQINKIELAGVYFGSGTMAVRFRY